jgi:Zn-dependent M28 family amino/carboxypeptidase
VRLFVAVAVLLSFTCFAQQSPMTKTTNSSAGTADTLTNSIDSEKIRAHVRFLSSDLLEGRGPGQRGNAIAADYIATQLDLAGLEPAGENGTYFQKVPMVAIKTLPESNFTLIGKNGEAMTLRGGDDYIAHSETMQPDINVDAPIVFVGYGINAPEYQWNDYAGVDVKGKVVLMFTNEPPSPLPNSDRALFRGKELTYYGRWTYKYEEAARQGAIGAILIHQTEMASYPWTVLSRGWGGETTFLRGTTEPKLQVASWVTFDSGKKLLVSSGLDIDRVLEQIRQRGFKPIDLGAKAKIHLVSATRNFDGQNVIARLDGDDPELRREAVIFTAHHDHFGIVHSPAGDKIFHGAVDNASGVAMLLEVARIAAQRHAKRSMIFATVDAEEQNLLGAKYLAEHPPIPLKNIILDLNFEGLWIMPVGVPEELQVSGAERTTFYPQVEQVAKNFGMTIRPDPFPEAGYYFRSDHFSFARAGVPAFSVAAGNKFQGHDLAWGEAQAKDFVAHRYHQPEDEYRPEMDFRANARIAQIAYALGWIAANDVQKVSWRSEESR